MRSWSGVIVSLCLCFGSGYTERVLGHSGFVSPSPKGHRFLSQRKGWRSSTLKGRTLGTDDEGVSFRPTVWSEFASLAKETGGVNLGQGFPNWRPPKFVRDAGVEAIQGPYMNNQYTRTAGLTPLVEFLAAKYSNHLASEGEHRTIDGEKEVAITVGASQGLYITMLSVLRPGDEVILFEPFFNLYEGQIKCAGATAKFVPMKFAEVSKESSQGGSVSGEWQLDVEALRSAITPLTRLIVLNTPMNPTGKVFTREELEAVAEVVRENPDVLVLSDEVYKFMIYTDEDDEDPEANVNTPVGHIHFASLPGMWDRTITVSSAGKTFSVTGWQVGWVVGPERFLAPIQLRLPFMQFCACTPMQQALVKVLEQALQPYAGEKSYYTWLRKAYAQRKAFLAQALENAGLTTVRGDGGFFMIADISNIEVPQKYLEESTDACPEMTRDWAFCRFLAIECGVVALPCSAFFSEKNKATGKNLVRFAFCKTSPTLQEAAKRLLKLRDFRKPDAPPLPPAGDLPPVEDHEDM